MKEIETRKILFDEQVNIPWIYRYFLYISMINLRLLIFSNKSTLYSHTYLYTKGISIEAPSVSWDEINLVFFYYAEI